MRPEEKQNSQSTGLPVLHNKPRSVPAQDAYTLERQLLEKVLASTAISRSASLVRFLSFICTKYFEGQSEEIREYAIAVDALGRRAGNYDSRVDPIVRVTARSLRKKLAEYYAGEGKDDALRIVLPLGHYVPSFVPVEAGAFESALEDEGDEAEPEELDNSHSPAASKAPDRSHPWWRNAWHSPWGKIAAGILCVGAVFASGYLIGREKQNQIAVASQPLAWGDPAWSDEFDGAPMQMPDPTKWSFEVGGGGWGSKQLQTYCSPGGVTAKGCDIHHPNAFLDGSGHLVLRAERSPGGNQWNSARITTRGLKEFQYGRIEVRLKMPVGKGLWPSVWMLGSDYLSHPWPESGSFDFVENVALNSGSNGLGPSMIRSTIHGPHYYGANGLWHDFHLPNGARVDDGNFHSYGVIWSPEMIQFYVDDPANVFFVANSSDIPDGSRWVFDHPFFLLMNLAVGGDWPGDPDGTTPNPADMLVDYVRLYRIPSVPAPSIEWHPVTVQSGATVSSNVQLNSPSYSGRVHLRCSVEPATATCALASPVVNFANTLSQQDTLTITTDSFTSSGRIAAPAGHYKLTITATSMSGDHSELSIPFEIRAQ